MRRDIRLGATDGWIRTPNSKSHYIFGFVDITGVPENLIFEYRGKAQLMAPLIDVKAGDEVYLTLTNLGNPQRPDLDDPHTVHWHGFPNQIPLYDGVPEASIAVPVFRNFTYYYKPLDPGTYKYHCHHEPVEHIQMGMTGPLIVRPADYDPALPSKKTAYGSGTGTQFNREYFVFLTEMDARAHLDIASVQEYDWSEYKPTYWLLNGRSYPDTLDDKNGGLFPQQPYPALIKANAGEKVLLRFINLGYQQHSMQLLGIPMLVVGQDAKRPLGLHGENLSYRKNAIYIAPGQTLDVIFTARQPGTYPFYNRGFHKNINAGPGPGGMITEIQVYAPGTLPPQTGPNQQ